MTQNCEIRELEARPMLSIRRQVAMADMSSVFAEIFPAVAAYIGEQGGQPAGMPLAIYHNMNMETQAVDVEGGMPVVAPLAGSGEIKAGEVPHGRMAVAAHFGPYDTIPETHQALSQWMADNGYQPAGPAWEVYITDPGAEPDPAKWQTDIYYPVVEV